MAELDGVEDVDLVEQALAEGEGGREEGVRGRHQPVGSLESPEASERSDGGDRNVEVVEEHVMALDRCLGPRDQHDPARCRIVAELLAEGEGLVVREGEDLEPLAGRAVDERASVVDDPGLRLAGVKVEIGFQ